LLRTEVEVGGARDEPDRARGGGRAQPHQSDVRIRAALRDRRALVQPLLRKSFG
jgi:hypothetical protein